MRAGPRVYVMGKLGSPVISFDASLENAKKFTPVPFPKGVAVVAVALSDIHCLALDLNGFIYGWGLNSSFQISHGIPRTETVYAPMLVRGSLRSSRRCL